MNNETGPIKELTTFEYLEKVNETTNSLSNIITDDPSSVTNEKLGNSIRLLAEAVGILALLIRKNIDNGNLM